MARKKKNPTPSLLAGQPAPGSLGNASGSAPEKSTGETPISRKRPGTHPPDPPVSLRLADPAPRGARLSLRLVLDPEDAEHLIRLSPPDETLESSALHYLLSILRDLDDPAMNGPLPGQEAADPRRGLRLVRGGPARSSPRREPPLPPCA